MYPPEDLTIIPESDESNATSRSQRVQSVSALVANAMATHPMDVDRIRILFRLFIGL